MFATSFNSNTSSTCPPSSSSSRPRSRWASTPCRSRSNWRSVCARHRARSPKRSSPDIGKVDGFDRLEVAGAGYINARLNRAEAATALIGSTTRRSAASPSGDKILVEHTSINPNKAAHIGHLRNAILGDTFVRLLRATGYPVDVQNYIDNTGVQVADVVVGFRELEKKIESRRRALIADTPRFDYYLLGRLCAASSQWYERRQEAT